MNVLTIKGVSIGEGMPKIIIPLMGKTEKQILNEAEAVKLLNPDIVEWRVDVFEKANDREAVTKLISKLAWRLYRHLSRIVNFQTRTVMSRCRIHCHSVHDDII